MEGFCYRNGELHCEDVAASDAAARFDTPLFLYSKASLVGRLRELREAFSNVPATICYSVKANSNMHLLRLIAEEGAGFDIVSGGELFRVIRAGARAQNVVFAGVGKKLEEIRDAIQADIWMFNVECESELDDIARVAGELGKTARIALRINPDIAANTHSHITTGKKEGKFGLAPAVAEALAKRCSRLYRDNIQLIGVHAHIGSQITTVTPHRLALRRLVQFAGLLEKRGIGIEYLNIGGGFGIRYKDEECPAAAGFAAALAPLVKSSGKKLIVEPGRYIVGNAAALLTRVIRVKESASGRKFVICDAAMNDLIRPVLYDAYHCIWPVRGNPPPLLARRGDACVAPTEKVDVVGPICESGDFFAKARPMPPIREGDVLAIFGAGAYGMSMSSNYNSRRRAAEALADGNNLLTIRSREDYTDLVRREEETCGNNQ